MTDMVLRKEKHQVLCLWLPSPGKVPAVSIELEGAVCVTLKEGKLKLSQNMRFQNTSCVEYDGIW